MRYGLGDLLSATIMALLVLSLSIMHFPVNHGQALNYVLASILSLRVGAVTLWNICRYTLEHLISTTLSEL